MAVKSVSIRIEEEMLKKLAYIAEYEGRRDDLSACHFFRLMSHSSSFNVADMLGISQSYISRLEKKILSKLKKEFFKMV